MLSKAVARWLDHIVSGPLRGLFQNPRWILRGYVRPGMTVLDVGAGTGYFSLGMARMVGSNGKVVAVDLEAEKIENLRDRATRAGLSERIRAQVCNDRSLCIDDLSGQVDFSLAYYVVHHAPDVESLMADVHKALKPGGKFLVVEPGHHASPETCAATETAAREAGFAIAGHPKLTRDWAVLFAKD